MQKREKNVFRWRAAQNGPGNLTEGEEFVESWLMDRGVEG